MSSRRAARIRGLLRPPGDKSISHRTAILSALARGRSTLENFAPGDDCARTLDMMRALGVEVEHEGGRIEIDGVDYFGFEPPTGPLDVGNSGTTARLACGLLAPQPFDSQLSGDSSLRRRPMTRVIEPLEAMGARLESLDGRAPLVIRGGRRLRGMDHALEVPSAQVKSAILLAGLHAEGSTSVREPLRSRNHTEIALRQFGVPLDFEGDYIRVQGGSPLVAAQLRIPGDISSAAFFIVAASFLPGSDLVVEDVGLNPTRTAFLKVLESMGAQISTEELGTRNGEPVGRLRVRGADLSGTEIPPEWIPSLIDEIPALMVAALYARGTTTVRGAGELRVKESDRIATLARGLTALGGAAETFPDGLRVRGADRHRGARLSSSGDHRMAMAWAIASIGTAEPCQIEDRDAVRISYPGFWEDFTRLVS